MKKWVQLVKMAQIGKMQRTRKMAQNGKNDIDS